MANYDDPMDFVFEAMDIYKEGHLESAIYVTCIAEEEFVKNMDFLGIMACLDFIEAVREKLEIKVQRDLVNKGIRLTSENLRKSMKERCDTNNLKRIVDEFNRPLSQSLRNRVVSYFNVDYGPIGSEAIYKRVLKEN